MSDCVDLHVHSTASDGTDSPGLLVEKAAALGLHAIAITDHDTVSGCLEAADSAAALGLELVPGIEISTKYGVAVHILGYYIDPAAPALRALLDWIVDDRDQRNRRMAELMAADGLPVSYEGMRQRFGQVIGRPHFGQLLVELGLASSVQDAFDRYVEKGRPYYLPRTVLPIERAVETIVSAGGAAVLAHPFQYRKDDRELRELIEHCMDHGLGGMECRYSGYSPQQQDYLERLARDYGLVMTGGSDYHGTNKPRLSLGTGTGALSVPRAWLGPLKAAANR